MSFSFLKSTLVATLLGLSAAQAADHADAPLPSNDQAMDLNDVYAFLDPNDNSKLILAVTFRGFIVPGEAVNFAFFDNLAQYRFDLELNGDAIADRAFRVRFSKRTSTSVAQTATITLPYGERFQAPVTLPTLGANANAFNITTDPRTDVSFFAGEVDDPFFFDIPGFARFAATARAGAPDVSILQRGRDTFAGYNTLAIALRLPVSYLRLAPGKTVVGVNCLAQRQLVTTFGVGKLETAGAFRHIDRAGNPGLNALVVPFARKDEFNLATPREDKNGRFTLDVAGALSGLGAGLPSIGTLAGIYLSNGDFLRVSTVVANSGTGGGDSAGSGFPNGRRLRDDVVDTFLTVVANGTPLGDNVNTNDVAFNNTFPFFAAPQQPRNNGVLDDNTRN